MLADKYQPRFIDMRYHRSIRVPSKPLSVVQNLRYMVDIRRATDIMHTRVFRMLDNPAFRLIRSAWFHDNE